MVQKKLYNEVLAPNMKQGAVLLFAHGLNVHFGMIEPRADLDVGPGRAEGPGRLVRREYEIGRGVPCIYAVYQDKSGKAEQFALTYAGGRGGARANIIKTTFKEETETDLFGEQAVLCGGASSLVQAGFETLVEAGYQPEIAYYEVLHELKLIVDLFYEGGITRMLEFVSETAQWGDYVSGPRVIDASVKARMKDVLTDIQNGTFTRNWEAEHAAGLPNYKKFKQADWTTRSRRWARNCARRWSGCSPTPSRTPTTPPRKELPPHERHFHHSGGRAAQWRGLGRACAGSRRGGYDLRLSGRRDHAVLRCARGLRVAPHPGPPRAGCGAGRERLRPRQRQGWRVRGHLRPGRVEPGDRHRRRPAGFGADGLHHR